MDQGKVMSRGGEGGEGVDVTVLSGALQGIGLAESEFRVELWLWQNPINLSA